MPEGVILAIALHFAKFLKLRFSRYLKNKTGYTYGTNGIGLAFDFDNAFELRECCKSHIFNSSRH